MQLLALVMTALGASVALAQVQTIVSPLGTATTDGNNLRALPWVPINSSPASAVNVSRYMQIHSDLGSGAKVIQKLAFRRNGVSAPQAGTRAIDLELWLGYAVDYDQCSWVYASNWLAAPTRVLARQVVNIGPLGAPGNPAPFEIAFPITPFVHAGVTSLAWDALIWANVESPPFTVPLDADGSSAMFGVGAVQMGQGCVASGQSSPMSVVLQHYDSGGTWCFGGYVDYAPANAPLFLALGARDPGLTVPGMCGALHTELAIVLPLGLTDASGFFGVPGRTGTMLTKGQGGPFAFALPNRFAGQTLYLQAHAVDAGSTLPIQIASSGGHALTVPDASTTKVVRVSRMFHTAGAPTAPWAAFHTQSSIAVKMEPPGVGFAVVTEFTY